MKSKSRTPMKAEYTLDVIGNYQLEVDQSDYTGCVGPLGEGLTLRSADASLFQEKLQFSSAATLSKVSRLSSQIFNGALTQGLFKQRVHLSAINKRIVGFSLNYDYFFSYLESSGENPTDPCLYAINPFARNCEIKELYEYRYNSKRIPDFNHLTSLMFLKGLEFSESEAFFTKGKILFRFDDWYGMVSYGSDFSFYPGIIMTNGQNVQCTFLEAWGGNYNCTDSSVMLQPYPSEGPLGIEEPIVGILISSLKEDEIEKLTMKLKEGTNEISGTFEYYSRYNTFIFSPAHSLTYNVEYTAELNIPGVDEPYIWNITTEYN